jgi:hypothetical protein
MQTAFNKPGIAAIASVALVAAVPSFAQQTTAASAESASNAPFASIDAGLQQDVFVASGPTVVPDAQLGGLAFSADGELWWLECVRAGTHAHRFSARIAVTRHQTTLRVETGTSAIPGGCALVSHPDGTFYTVMDAGKFGIAQLDRTGAPMRRFGPPANALGLTVDPLTQHLVYVGRECLAAGDHDGCAVVDVDPVTEQTRTFARIDTARIGLLGAIAFDPDAKYLFVALRGRENGIAILDRAGAIVQRFVTPGRPEGIAFSAALPRFVVLTTGDGTLARLDFSDDEYREPPSMRTIGRGGFGGGHAQVGQDGCLYVSQESTRYRDGVVTPESSIVRVCGGFAPPPAGAVPPHGIPTALTAAGSSSRSVLLPARP